MLSSITKRFSKDNDTNKDLYDYGELHEVEIEISFRKTYKTKAITKDEAIQRVHQKVMKQNKTYQRARLNLVSSKTISCKPLLEAK